MHNVLPNLLYSCPDSTADCNMDAVTCQSIQLTSELTATYLIFLILMSYMVVCIWAEPYCLSNVPNFRGES